MSRKARRRFIVSFMHSAFSSSEERLEILNTGLLLMSNPVLSWMLTYPFQSFSASAPSVSVWGKLRMVVSQ